MSDNTRNRIIQLWKRNQHLLPQLYKIMNESYNIPELFDPDENLWAKYLYISMTSNREILFDQLIYWLVINGCNANHINDIEMIVINSFDELLNNNKYKDYNAIPYDVMIPNVYYLPEPIEYNIHDEDRRAIVLKEPVRTKEQVMTLYKNAALIAKIDNILFNF